MQNISSPKKQNHRKVLEPLGKSTEPQLSFRVIAVESSIKSDVRPYTTIMQNNIPTKTFSWAMPGAHCARDNESGEPLVLDQLGVGARIPRGQDQKIGAQGLWHSAS